MESLNLLKIIQVDKKLNILSGFEIPKTGWINLIRKSLGLTYAQIAKRINSHPQVIKQFEKNEVEGTITLKTLQKIAASIECRLVYAIVPDSSLENIIESNADKVADKITKRVTESMGLESQTINKEEIQRQKEEIKYELKRNPKKIWKYEI